MEKNKSLIQSKAIHLLLWNKKIWNYVVNRGQKKISQAREFLINCNSHFTAGKKNHYRKYISASLKHIDSKIGALWGTEKIYTLSNQNEYLTFSH